MFAEHKQILVARDENVDVEDLRMREQIIISSISNNAWIRSWN